MTKSNKTTKSPPLDAYLRGKICAAVQLGCSRATAASYVGCHSDKIRQAAQHDERFARELEHAESMNEVRNLSAINKAAEDTRYWRAAAWALERTLPGRYGTRRPDQITPEQLSQALASFADALLDEISDPEERQRIQARLADLATGLQSLTQGADA